MATSKLVSDLRRFDGSHLYFHKATHLLIRRKHYLVNVALL